MSKRLLFIGINFLPELTGIGKYTGEMVTQMAEMGYECEVVTGFPYYPQWQIQKPYRGIFYRRESLRDGRIKITRCPLYVAGKTGGMARILLEVTFFFTAFWALVGFLFKPRCDYIFCVAPPFHLGLLALFYRFFKGGKIIYHVQDLQVDAARDLGMIFSPGLFRIMFGVERFILESVDEVSSISKGMMERISRKVDRPVSFFPNWVDTDHFHPIEDRIALKENWGFSASDRIVLYSGSIGEKQGLEAILGAAVELSDLKFIICGTGPYHEKLRSRVEDDRIGNIFFLPLQPLESLCEFLNIADLQLILQKEGAGDLMMPSKLTNIMAVGGLVLVTASPGSSLFELVEGSSLGIVIPPENPDSLVEGIRTAFTENCQNFRKNARRYAEENISREHVFKNLVPALLENCAAGTGDDFRKSVEQAL